MPDAPSSDKSLRSRRQQSSLQHLPSLSPHSMAFLLLKLATIGIVMASATTALTLPSVRDNSGERSSGKFKSLVSHACLLLFEMR